MSVRLKKWLKEKINIRGEQGVSLVEAAVTVVLLGGAVLAMILSISGGALAVQVNDEQVTAQALARTQMEYIKEYPYDPDATTYPTITAPADYDITVTVGAVPDTTDTIQKITVDIARNEITLLTVENYKEDR